MGGPRRRVVIMGAGGRDFHDFATTFRDDPDVEVVAFTAAQIPGIDDRRYPASLAGPAYPDGIPIVAEDRLEDLLGAGVDEVVLAYSDLAHAEVMHRASRVLAGGADFRLLGPARTELVSRRPVLAVCATRTGCGKSQIARSIGRMAVDRGLRVALVRHPMPYGDLEAMAVQRFASLADIDASSPTVEEREEYEPAVEAGLLVFAGVDYATILRRAEAEADLIIWDGGNNDLPFLRPDLLVTVADARRPGHELAFHPGEANVRRADVVVVNKVSVAPAGAVAEVVSGVGVLNPAARVVLADSPATLDDGPDLAGVRVLVVEDGPTVTHGGLPDGAGAAAARAAGAVLVDPRRWAVGSIAETFARCPHLGPVLPAVGYGEQQVRELAATIAAVDCDVVVVGTPIDLARVVPIERPVRRVTYRHADVGAPTLADVVGPFLERCRT